MISLRSLPASALLLLTLSGAPSFASGQCQAHMIRSLEGLAEGYERCLQKLESRQCPIRWDSDAKYLESASKYCSGQTELSRAKKGFEAAKAHVAGLAQKEQAKADQRTREAEALEVPFRELTGLLGDDRALQNRHSVAPDKEPIRLAARSDTEHARVVEALDGLEKQAKLLEAKYGQLTVTVAVLRRLPVWKAALQKERALYEAERPLLEHWVVGNGAFTAEDSYSPARIAEAFKQLGKTHLLEVALLSNNGNVLFRYSPTAELRVPTKASEPQKGEYKWAWPAQGWGIYVALSPFVQADLPVGTPVLAWAPSRDGKHFIVVTPDGGRYFAPMTAYQGNRVVAVVRKAGEGPLRFSALRDTFPLYGDFQHEFGDIPSPALKRIDAEAKKAKSCHEKIAAQYDKQLAPLETLHEDLLDRGLVAESVWRKMEKLKDKESAAHDKNCKPAHLALEKAVKAAQAAYVKAREKAWKETSRALAIEAAP